MNATFRNILIIVLLIIVLIITLYTCNQRKTIDAYVEKINVDSIEIKKWKDDAGNEHALSNTIKLSAIQYMKLKDSVISVLRKQVISPDNLLVKNTITIRTHDTIRTSLHDTTIIVKNVDNGKIVDTISFKQFHYNDQWIDINGEIHLNDSINLNYSVNNKVDIINFYKKQGLFKPKKLVVDVINLNPHSNTEKLQSFTVEPKKRRFYETRIFSFILGAATSIFIEHKLN